MESLRSTASSLLTLFLVLLLAPVAEAAAPDPFGAALARSASAPGQQEALADLFSAATWLPYESPPFKDKVSNPCTNTMPVGL